MTIGRPGDEGPFSKLLRITPLYSENGKGGASMPVHSGILQKEGVVQGGIIVSLIDHALYLAVKSLLSERQSTVTIELKINFLAPAKNGVLVADGHVVRMGKRIAVVYGEVKDHKDILIAQGMGTWMIRGDTSS